MTESRRWLTYEIIVFYCFLSSARACMTLGDNPYVDLVLSIIALAICPKRYFIHVPQRMFAAFLLAISAMYTMIGAPVTGYLAQFAMVFIPCQLIFLRREYQVELFEWLTRWYAVLLIASFVWWILWIMGVNLPHSAQKMAWEYNDDGFILENYYLFRHTINLNVYAAIESVMRFNGFFLEPGHLGTITSLFLFIGKFDLSKWQNKIFILVIIFTFSAAAYMLTLTGYCMYRYAIDRWRVAFTFLMSALVIFLISQYNGGDNVINEIVFGKFTREQGAVEGRFSFGTQKLWNEVVADGSIIWGKGANVNITQSAGYKVFLIMNGILGAVITLCAYWRIYIINSSKLGLLLLLLLIISFLQRTYCFWDAFLDPFILGTACLCHNKKYEEHGFETLDSES